MVSNRILKVNLGRFCYMLNENDLVKNPRGAKRVLCLLSVVFELGYLAM